jgi:hypothetical protein
MLFFILAAGFLVKLPALFNPLVGHFGSYQALNAMMAEMMVFGGTEALIIPKSFFILEGAAGVHLLYYPFASLASAVLTSLIGGEFDFWGRFQAAAFMAGSGFFIYQIAKKQFSRNVGLYAAAFFTLSPMALIYGVAFQNESVSLFFLVLAYWILLKGSTTSAIVAAILFSLSVVGRVHFVVLFPAFAVTILSSHGKRIGHLLLFTLFTAIPSVTWFGWMGYLEQTRVGVMTGFWGQLGEGRIVHDILKKPEFYGRMLELLLARWMTPIVVLLMMGGVLSAGKKSTAMLLWFLGTVAILFLLPKKTFDHPFYLISGIPPACIFAGIAFDQLMSRPSRRKIAIALAVIFLLISARFYIPPVFAFSPLERSIPAIGAEIEKRTRSTDKIIASHGGSCDLLYYAKRRGWTFSLEIERVPIVRHKRILKQLALGHDSLIGWVEYGRSQGARYFILTEIEKFKQEVDFYRYVTDRYKRVSTDEDPFLMYDLRTGD